MSTFDIVPDAPGLLRSEAINITLKFDRTGPTTGRVSWNIPTPAAGCTAETQAYCGIVVTIDTQPASVGKIPVNGQIYTADPTADSNLFAGDRIGTAGVVGAFYEDRTTTFMDVTGLKPNTPYYVTAYPVDCQYRYFVEGVHAYSTEFKNRGHDGTSGTQVVVFNPNAVKMGALGTDNTGLTPGQEYSFTIQVGVVPKPNRPIDSVECQIKAPTYNVTINGTNAQTVTALVTAINNAFAALTPSPSGPVAPNTGAYYWNAQQRKLFQWNGTAHIEIPVLYETNTPTAVSVGTYWHNPTTGVLNRWNGTAWVTTTVHTAPLDPALPIAEYSYWVDGSNNVFLWNGVTWCSVATTHSATDPSLAVEPPGGSFWFNTATSSLYKWDNALNRWISASAVLYPSDPLTLAVGSYWFDESTNVLKSYNSPQPGWNVIANVAVVEVAPSMPAPGKLWFNPATNELWQRDPSNTTWVEIDVVVHPVDPTVEASCGVWWDTNDDKIYVRDSINDVWVEATSFFQQNTDPAAAPTIVEGAVWHDTTSGSFYVWNNQCFKLITPTISATDPRFLADGVVWYNASNKEWKVRSAGTWVAIDPIDSATDPRSLNAGAMWFNPSNNGLQMWNGSSWVAVLYGTSPLTPAKGTLWLNTTTNVLLEWNGTAWVSATTLVTVEHDCNGNLLFTDTSVGSTSFIMLTDVSLFSSLTIANTFHTPSPGTDGASDTPSYMEIGIGTSGDDSVRNAIINDIRYELGYPVVDVELTKDQLDYAVSRAISVLRQRSGLAYKHGFFFMELKANEQRYYLTNKISGMNKIVEVLGVYRLTSSFLSSAHGAGVYGQIVLQHMYNMGTFDLLSYHLMSDYTKLMEILFAGRITFTWNEQTRELWMHHRFSMREPMVCIEATVERTEQDIMSDRYAQSWIRKYATGYARIMLAEIRGKFSSLPGAGGSVTLNADALRTAGQADIDSCIAEIENYTVDRPEEYGMGTQFVFG